MSGICSIHLGHDAACHICAATTFDMLAEEYGQAVQERAARTAALTAALAGATALLAHCAEQDRAAWNDRILEAGRDSYITARLRGIIAALAAAPGAGEGDS